MNRKGGRGRGWWSRGRERGRKKECVCVGVKRVYVYVLYGLERVRVRVKGECEVWYCEVVGGRGSEVVGVGVGTRKTGTDTDDREVSNRKYPKEPGKMEIYMGSTVSLGFGHKVGVSRQSARVSHGVHSPDISFFPTGPVPVCQ